MKEKHVYTTISLLLVLAYWGSVSMAASLPELEENSIRDDDDSSQVVSKGSGPLRFFAMTKALVKEQARLASTSEVLTLNLTNLIILLVVKAIIFGFGFLGTAAGRRSSDSGLTFNQADMMMMMSYALGSTTNDYQCLYLTACQEPQTAHQYMTASKMLMKGAKLLKK